MQQKQRTRIIIVLLISLLLALSGCETLIEILETPLPTVYVANTEGIAQIPDPEQMFTVRLSDPLILMVPVERTGYYEFVNLDHPQTLLYMSIFSMELDKKAALAENMDRDTVTDRFTVFLEKGQSYLIGIGILGDAPSGLNVDFQLIETTEPKTFAVVDAPPTPLDVPPQALTPPEEEASKPFAEVELAPIIEDDIFAFADQEAPEIKARTFTPFVDDTTKTAKNTLSGPQQGILTKENGPYLISGDVTVPSGSSLIIEEGTIIRMSPHTTVHIQGTLETKGKAGSEVVFVGNDSQTAGSWGGFIFYKGSKATLEGTRILGAGAQKIVEGRWLTGSVIALGDAQPSIIDCEIAQGMGPGILSSGEAKPIIRNNSFKNLEVPVQMESLASAPAEITGNRFSSITRMGIEVQQNVLASGQELTLQASNIPYIFKDFTIQKGATLTIFGTSVVKFHPGTGLTVEGNLNVSGALSGSVTFTSLKDDLMYDSNGDKDASKPASGDWNGILFTNEGGGKLNAARIMYAGSQRVAEGSWRSGSIIVGGSANPEIEGCLIAHSPVSSITVYGNAKPTFTGNILRDAQYPVTIQDAKSFGIVLNQNSYQKMKYMGINVEAQKIQSGNAVTIQRNDSLPYVLNTFIVEPNATLNVESGTILKFRSGSSLMVQGTLLSESDPSYWNHFTSDTSNLNGDSNGDGKTGKPQKGDWGGIVFESDAKGSFALTTISFAGSQKVVGGAWREGAITIGGTSHVDFFFSGIGPSKSSAFTFLDQGNLKTDQIEIWDTDWIGKAYDVRAIPKYMSASGFADNITYKAIRLETQEIKGGVHAEIDGENLPGLVFVSNNLHIQENASLLLHRTTLKMEPNTQILVEGEFSAFGNPGYIPMVITSIKDDFNGDTNGDGNQSKPAAGDWGGIAYREGARGTLDMDLIDYAGGQTIIEGAWRTAALISAGRSTPDFRKVTIDHSSGDGILILSDAKPSLGQITVNNQKGVAINR